MRTAVLASVLALLLGSAWEASADRKMLDDGGFVAPIVPGSDCSSLGPNELAACCAAKPTDPACPAPGSDCASRGPDNLAACCAENPTDPACPPPGSDCASRGPDNLAACCAQNPTDPACPPPGSDCASRGPDNLAACCAENPTDPSCPAPGSTCASTGPANYWGCCTNKTAGADSTCPPPQCGELPAADASACCASKGTNAYQTDSTCPAPPPPPPACLQNVAPFCRILVEDVFCDATNGLISSRPWVDMGVVCSQSLAFTLPAGCISVTGPGNVTVNEFNYYDYIATWAQSSEPNYVGDVTIQVDTSIQGCNLQITTCTAGGTTYNNAAPPQPLTLKMVDAKTYASDLACLKNAWEVDNLAWTDTGSSSSKCQQVPRGLLPTNFGSTWVSYQGEANCAA